MNQGLSRRRLLQSAMAGISGAVASSAWPRPAPAAAQFKLGIITDEITQKLEEALNFVSSYSLHYCELRELWGKNIMNASKDDLQRAKDLIAEHHLTVSDIGSPIMKYNLPEMPARKEKRDTFRANFTEEDTQRLLDQSFELASFFGTRKVRIFSYWRVADPEKVYTNVRDRLSEAAEHARKADILLVLENEHECNIGTGKELGRVLKEINSDHLKGNWDPGNAAMLAELPFPDGYQQVRGTFAHMHAKDVKKDAVTGKLRWAPVGGGFIDWKGQIKALLADDYEGTISLETHYRRPDGNKVESTRESLEGLLQIIKQV